MKHARPVVLPPCSALCIVNGSNLRKLRCRWLCKARRLKPGALADVNLCPAALHRACHGQAMLFNQTVNMGLLERQRFHAVNHGRRWRSTRRHGNHIGGPTLLRGGRSIDQHAINDRCGAKVGDAMLADCVKNFLGTDTPQAYIDTCAPPPSRQSTGHCSETWAISAKVPRAWA